MYLEYPSSQNPDLRLFAEITLPEEPKLIRVQMHGWHGQVKKAHSDNVFNGDEHLHWLVVRPEMRGRGDSTGRQDCNGWELQDVIDAVRFVQREFPDRVLDPERVILTGGSGGGGNVYGLLGKFPDFFCRAQANCGITDYALWHRNDHVGEFRDEMETAGWIGGSPDTRPEAYASRGGLTTVANLLTPLIMFHGDLDDRVPAEHARLYLEKARQLGKGDLVAYHELKGVGLDGHWGGATPEQQDFRVRVGAEFISLPADPVCIPQRGHFVVAGYLKTKRFEVILDPLTT